MGAAQVSEGLTTEHIPKVREHALHAGRARVCTRVGVMVRWLSWALHYRSQVVHGWRAAACCGFNLVGGDDDVANKIDDLKVLGDIK